MPISALRGDLRDDCTATEQAASSSTMECSSSASTTEVAPGVPPALSTAFSSINSSITSGISVELDTSEPGEPAVTVKPQPYGAGALADLRSRELYSVDASGVLPIAAATLTLNSRDAVNDLVRMDEIFHGQSRQARIAIAAKVLRQKRDALSRGVHTASSSLRTSGFNGPTAGVLRVPAVRRASLVGDQRVVEVQISAPVHSLPAPKIKQSPAPTPSRSSARVRASSVASIPVNVEVNAKGAAATSADATAAAESTIPASGSVDPHPKTVMNGFTVTLEVAIDAILETFDRTAEAAGTDAAEEKENFLVCSAFGLLDLAVDRLVASSEKIKELNAMIADGCVDESAVIDQTDAAANAVDDICWLLLNHVKVFDEDFPHDTLTGPVIAKIYETKAPYICRLLKLFITRKHYRSTAKREEEVQTKFEKACMRMLNVAGLKSQRLARGWRKVNGKVSKKNHRGTRDSNWNRNMTNSEQHASTVDLDFMVRHTKVLEHLVSVFKEHDRLIYFRVKDNFDISVRAAEGVKKEGHNTWNCGAFAYYFPYDQHVELSDMRASYVCTEPRSADNKYFGRTYASLAPSEPCCNSTWPCALPLDVTIEKMEGPHASTGTAVATVSFNANSCDKTIIFVEIKHTIDVFLLFPDLTTPSALIQDPVVEGRTEQGTVDHAIQETEDFVLSTGAINYNSVGGERGRRSNKPRRYSDQRRLAAIRARHHVRFDPNGKKRQSKRAFGPIMDTDMATRLGVLEMHAVLRDIEQRNHALFPDKDSGAISVADEAIQSQERTIPISMASEVEKSGELPPGVTQEEFLPCLGDFSVQHNAGAPMHLRWHEQLCTLMMHWWWMTEVVKVLLGLTAIDPSKAGQSEPKKRQLVYTMLMAIVCGMQRMFHRGMTDSDVEAIWGPEEDQKPADMREYRVQWRSFKLRMRAAATTCRTVAIYEELVVILALYRATRVGDTSQLLQLRKVPVPWLDFLNKHNIFRDVHYQYADFFLVSPRMFMVRVDNAVVSILGNEGCDVDLDELYEMLFAEAGRFINKNGNPRENPQMVARSIMTADSLVDWAKVGRRLSGVSEPNNSSMATANTPDVDAVVELLFKSGCFTVNLAVSPSPSLLWSPVRAASSAIVLNLTGVAMDTVLGATKLWCFGHDDQGRLPVLANKLLAGFEKKLVPGSTLIAAKPRYKNRWAAQQSYGIGKSLHPLRTAGSIDHEHSIFRRGEDLCDVCSKAADEADQCREKTLRTVVRASAGDKNSAQTLLRTPRTSNSPRTAKSRSGPSHSRYLRSSRSATRKRARNGEGRSAVVV